MVQDLVHNLCESLVVNIGGVAGIGKKNPPTPITYLTQWKIVGNSEVHGNEIWSCGEYNATDGKYHILVQPLGGSIADIALTEPLRKVKGVADTIEFPSETEGKALVTRNLTSIDLSNRRWNYESNAQRYYITNTFSDLKAPSSSSVAFNGLCSIYTVSSGDNTHTHRVIGISLSIVKRLYMYDPDYSESGMENAVKAHFNGVELIAEIETPTTETIQVPDIEVSPTDTYTCEISQGGKAVEWSSFETN